MKRVICFLSVVGLMGMLFLVSCGTTPDEPGPTMSDNHARVDWVYSNDKRYGVIRMGDNKWFPYFDNRNKLRWNDVIYNVPQYGETNTQIDIANTNRRTNVYLYEHKLSFHRAKSYIRMITTFGETSGDRGF